MIVKRLAYARSLTPDKNETPRGVNRVAFFLHNASSSELAVRHRCAHAGTGAEADVAIARAAVQNVGFGAAAAFERVVAGQAAQGVVARAAVELVGAGIAGDQVLTRPAEDIVQVR